MKFMIRKIALSCGLAAIVYSCSDGEKRGKLNDKQNVNIVTARDTIKVERVKKIFYTLPSPLEITMLFKKEGVEYHRDILHSVEKRKAYSTSVSKAFNLGVYGADLSYSGLFGQHEAAIQFLAASTILADDLGLGTTFQEDFIVRLERHSGNKDTLLKVIEDFFVQNDQQLEQNKGQDLSSCVLIGGWIEGMYLGTKILNENTDASAIRNILFNQREALHNLNLLAKNIDKTNLTGEILKELELIEEAYNNSEGEISEENFFVITSKIATIREYIIQLS